MLNVCLFQIRVLIVPQNLSAKVIFQVFKILLSLFKNNERAFKKLFGVHPTAESSSAVCITPHCQTAHSRVNISGFFKRTIMRRNPFRGEHISWTKIFEVLNLNVGLLNPNFWLRALSTLQSFWRLFRCF